MEELEEAISRLESALRRVKRYSRRLRRRMRELRKRAGARGFWIDHTYVGPYGPYYRLRWIEGGRARCVYLGRTPDIRKGLHVIDVDAEALRGMAELAREAARVGRHVKKAELELLKAIGSRG